jgi:Rieske 2Fe-2S family protein
VADRLGDLASIERYETEDLEVGRRITYDVKANWKLIIENFMECYHCATIHPELTEVLPEFADGFAAQYFVGHGAEFAEDAQGFTVDGSEGFDRLPASRTTRTAATTPSRSSRRCSSTSSRTT